MGLQGPMSLRTTRQEKTMNFLLFLLAYVAVIACVGIILMKICGYRKKPVHNRWELYPVAHELGDRASYGGSYFEDNEWWKKKQEISLVGAIKGFLEEALFLHATYVHNRPLWNFTYPFHVGLYLLLGSFALTILCALFPVSFFIGLAFISGFFGYLLVLAGAAGLLHRRLNTPDLRKFSMPEHYFNLGLFIAFGALGLLLSFSGFGGVERSAKFFWGVMTFSPALVAEASSFLYGLYLLVCYVILVWVPFSFMGHAFMKYFTWHDIRWGNQPTQDNPNIADGMRENAGRPVSWKAPHIQGDGRKTWAEVNATNPTQKGKE